MKVIFLDADGVMNGFLNWPEYAGRQWIDPKCVKHLNRITEATGAVIVMTSTWRLYCDFEGILKCAGVKAEIVGSVPEMKGHSRGDEIKAWIEERQARSRTAGDPVQSFVILDDDTDMEDLLPHLVCTTWERGLEDKHANTVIDKLNALGLAQNGIRIEVV